MKLSYIYPAQCCHANFHREANKFGYNRKKKDKDSDETIPLCPCCEVPKNVKSIPMCQSTEPEIRTK